jgi:hypothetical protein
MDEEVEEERYFYYRGKKSLQTPFDFADKSFPARRRMTMKRKRESGEIQ